MKKHFSESVRMCHYIIKMSYESDILCLQILKGRCVIFILTELLLSFDSIEPFVEILQQNSSEVFRLLPVGPVWQTDFWGRSSLCSPSYSGTPDCRTQLVSAARYTRTSRSYPPPRGRDPSPAGTSSESTLRSHLHRTQNQHRWNKL